MTVNPLTYDAVKILPPPFGMGNVWATILWEVYRELIAALVLIPISMATGHAEATISRCRGVPLPLAAVGL